MVEDLVMEPDRLKEFAGHRRQDGFVSHVSFFSVSALIVSRNRSREGLAGFAKQLCRNQRLGVYSTSSLEGRRVVSLDASHDSRRRTASPPAGRSRQATVASGPIVGAVHGD